MARRLSFLRSRTSTRAVALTAATGGASLLVGASQALLAHVLPIREVGAVSFTLSFLLLASLVFEFGFFLPIPRLIALERSAATRRELVGAGLLLFAPVGVLFVVFVLLASRFVDAAFHVSAGGLLLAGAALSWPYPFLGVAFLLAQGTGKIERYSASTFLAPALFVAVLAATVASQVHLSPEAAVLVRGGCYAVAALSLMRWLRPRFTNAMSHLPRLWQECRRYGFKLYVGNVLALGTYQMDVLMLAALTNARTVALYAVATSVTQVIALPGTSLSASLFARMARTGRIPAEWLAALCGITAVATLLIWLLSRPFLSFAFSAAYVSAAAYIIPLGLAAALRGVTGIYNAQLAASANGRALRSSALVLAVSNICLNFALIPTYKGMGAAVASAGAMLANLLAHIYFSRRQTASGPDPRAGDRRGVPSTLLVATGEEQVVDAMHVPTMQGEP